MMIKPDAVAAGNIGNILKMVTDAGFRIVSLKLTRLSRVKAEQFYAIHQQKVFFKDLVDFMTSGPIVAALIEKDNAVADYRKLIGATNPEQAGPGTVRKLYATNVERNAVHGSDSDENARIEADFFFSTLERY